MLIRHFLHQIPTMPAETTIIDSSHIKKPTKLTKIDKKRRFLDRFRRIFSTRENTMGTEEAISC